MQISKTHGKVEHQRTSAMPSLDTSQQRLAIALSRKLERLDRHTPGPSTLNCLAVFEGPNGHLVRAQERVETLPPTAPNRVRDVLYVPVVGGIERGFYKFVSVPGKGLVAALKYGPYGDGRPVVLNAPEALGILTRALRLCSKKNLCVDYKMAVHSGGRSLYGAYHDEWATPGERPLGMRPPK